MDNLVVKKNVICVHFLFANRVRFYQIASWKFRGTLSLRTIPNAEVVEGTAVAKRREFVRASSNLSGRGSAACHRPGGEFGLVKKVSGSGVAGRPAMPYKRP